MRLPRYPDGEARISSNMGVWTRVTREDVMDQLHGWRLANRFAVPGTGKRGGHYGCRLRSPRNATIKRGLMAAGVDLRGAKIPPNRHDDLYRQAVNDRNW